jgi:regulator of RNase E activity RraA
MSDASDFVRRLGRLDACAVSDAMDKLGLASAVTGLAQRSTTRRIAGRVVTYRLIPAVEAPPPPPGHKPRHLGTTAIERAEPGDIIVVEQRTGIDAGCWGGILSLAAKLRGVAGVIADGPVRDVDEARGYELPVYSRATTARTARARVAEAETGGPVRMGEVTVNTGDYAIADASGVVFIAAEHIGRLLDTAEDIARREAFMAKALLAGRPVTEVMGIDYEDMLKSGKETP